MLPRDAEQRAFIIAVCEWKAREVGGLLAATDFLCRHFAVLRHQ